MPRSIAEGVGRCAGGAGDLDRADVRDAEGRTAGRATDGLADLRTTGFGVRRRIVAVAKLREVEPVHRLRWGRYIWDGGA